LQGGTLTTSGSGESSTVGKDNANVVCGNVQTANATVYIIDSVLMPPPSNPANGRWTVRTHGAEGRPAVHRASTRRNPRWRRPPPAADSGVGEPAVEDGDEPGRRAARLSPKGR
jgi:hypothetical protein